MVEILKQGYVEVMKLNLGRDSKTRFGKDFKLILVKILMFG